MSTTTSAPAGTSAAEPAGDRPGHTENEIVIAADLDLVWDTTNDLERWPQLFTEYAACEVLDHSGDTFRFRLTMHPDEQGRVWSWVSERTLDREARRVTARRVEPGPFEFMDIAWTYTAVDGGTLMRWVQDFRMRPQAPVDTAGMTERINANSPVQMAHIAEQVEAESRSAAPTAGTTTEEDA